MGTLASLRGKLVGVDTSPFIYLIERNPAFLALVKPFFEAVARGEIRVITSALTLTEVLVRPLQFNDQELVEKYSRILLRADHIETVDVSSDIATAAASLRSIYKHRTPDAIQLATATQARADAFLTNDAGFANRSPIEVLMVAQLRGMV